MPHAALITSPNWLVSFLLPHFLLVLQINFCLRTWAHDVMGALLPVSSPCLVPFQLPALPPRPVIPALLGNPPHFWFPVCSRWHLPNFHFTSLLHLSCHLLVCHLTVPGVKDSLWVREGGVTDSREKWGKTDPKAPKRQNFHFWIFPFQLALAVSESRLALGVLAAEGGSSF